MADNIFPLLDRQAPLLSKLRDAESEESFEDLGERLGKEIGAISRMDMSTEEEDAAHQEVVEGMVRGISSSTGLDVDDVNFEFVETLTDSLFNESREVLNPPDELTLDEIDGEEEETEEE